MPLTNEQKGRLLERLASIIHEDLVTEGFQEIAEVMDNKAARAPWERERDKYLRRAAKLLGGEASTHARYGGRS